MRRQWIASRTIYTVNITPKADPVSLIPIADTHHNLLSLPRRPTTPARPYHPHRVLTPLKFQTQTHTDTPHPHPPFFPANNRTTTPATTNPYTATATATATTASAAYTHAPPHDSHRAKAPQPSVPRPSIHHQRCNYTPNRLRTPHIVRY